MNRRAVAVLAILVVMVGASSLVIVISDGVIRQEAPSIQKVSNEKIHLQDVDGKIHTNVPVAASRTFSPLPVQFDDDQEPSVVSGVTLATTVQTKQKVVVNFALAVATTGAIDFRINNNSEDKQLFLIKAGAPPQVILDMETGDSSDVVIHGITGHNEWLASVVGGSDGTDTDNDFHMEVSTTDAGFYPIVVELLRVG